jgi:hypothetical protein
VGLPGPARRRGHRERVRLSSKRSPQPGGNARSFALGQGFMAQLGEDRAPRPPPRSAIWKPPRRAACNSSSLILPTPRAPRHPRHAGFPSAGRPAARAFGSYSSAAARPLAPSPWTVGPPPPGGRLHLRFTPCAGPQSSRRRQSARVPNPVHACCRRLHVPAGHAGKVQQVGAVRRPGGARVVDVRCALGCFGH